MNESVGGLPNLLILGFYSSIGVRRWKIWIF